jgi:hypothetical protein
VDVFELPGPGDPNQNPVQIHDLNPSEFHPTHLFWTIAIPETGVQVNLGSGNASMQASDVPVIDHHDGGNSLFGGGPPPVHGAKVSFRVVWSGVQERVKIRNTDPVYGGFAGTFIRNTAQMEWTATAGDYSFVSAPLETSSSGFAQIGEERNGSFFA